VKVHAEVQGTGVVVDMIRGGEGGVVRGAEVYVEEKKSKR